MATLEQWFDEHGRPCGAAQGVRRRVYEGEWKTVRGEKRFVARRWRDYSRDATGDPAPTPEEASGAAV